MPPRAAPAVLVCGQSQPGPCGVRDYATSLREGLESRGVATAWCWLDQPAARTPVAALRSDARLLRAVLRATRPGTVVSFQYSPFATSWRGVPLLVPLLGVLARARGARFVPVLHELVYPWRRSGARGLAWAVSQRIAIVPLARAAHALVVTTDDRADWLRRRLRVPASRVAVVPVWSSMPREAAAPLPAPPGPVVAMFGWGVVEAAERDIALAALARLPGETRLALVGGHAAPAAVAAWHEAAARHGVAGRLDVTGPLSRDDVARHLRAATVCLHLDSTGPSPRKSSLATALGLGLPIVATDGPGTWPALRAAGAALVVPPSPDALAAAVSGLLADERARVALGAAATRFYDESMALPRALDTLVGVFTA